VMGKLGEPQSREAEVSIDSAVLIGDRTCHWGCTL
jgi:hypothetical protein